MRALPHLTSIRAKMLLHFGALFVATILVILLVEIFGLPFGGFEGIYHEKRQEAMRQLNTLAETKKETLQQWLYERRSDARMVSNNELIEEQLGELLPLWRASRGQGASGLGMSRKWNARSDVQTIQNRLRTLRQTHEDFEEVDIVDPLSGAVMFSTEESLLGKSFPRDKFFESACKPGNEEVIDTAVRLDTGKLDYLIAQQVAVRGATGNDFVLAIFRIDAERAITPLLQQGIQALGETGDVVLLNQDMKLLAPVRHPLMDGSIPNLFAFKVDTVPERLAARGGDGMVAALDYRGVAVLAAYRHLRVSPDFAWALVVKRDQTEVFAPLRETLWRIGLVGLVGLLAAFVLVFIIAARLSRPIERLADSAKRIEQGDFEVRSGLTGVDEIATLAHTFDAMAGQIQSWHHELSSEVERRTHQLERANRLYATLSETNKAIARFKERDELLAAACRIPVEVGKLRMAWLGFFDADGKLSIQASYGLPENAREYVENTPCRECMSSGRPMIANELDNCPSLASWKLVELEGHEDAIACCPLTRSGQVVGLIALCAAEADFFDAMGISLVTEIATDLSLALDSFDRERMLFQQSRLAAMGEMIGNIAHQWRQPINALNLLLANIKDDYEYGELNRESLDKNVQQGELLIMKMASTIDDFRDFFKPNREKTRINIRESIQNTLKLLESSLRNNDIAVVLEGDEKVFAYGYPNEYSQVMLNLLSNAKDVILENNVVQGRITIQTYREGANAVAVFRDNGGGIPEAVLPRLFQPYFTTKEKGTGIGLYMSKLIIESHMSGSIDAFNEGEGAAVRVRCPMMPLE